MSGLTMLLADDESIERNSLAGFIRESLPQIDTVETAENGFELLTKAEYLKPDILMVDVEMPGISGLDSIELLHKRALSGRIIIYSAYNYFEYAREAISLRVDAYVLKPARRAELAKVLSEIAERAQTDKVTAGQLRQARRIISLATPLLEAEFVKSVIFDDMQSEALANCLEMLDLQFAAGIMVTFSLEEDRTDSAIDLRSILKAKTLESMKVLAGPLIHGQMNACLHFGDDPPDDELVRRCRDWLAAMLDYVSTAYRLTLRAGMGSPCRRLADLPGSYLRSLSDEADGRPADSSLPDTLRRDEAIILSLILDHEDRKAVDHIRRLFGEMSLAGVSVLACRRMVRDFILRIWTGIRRRTACDRAIGSVLEYPLESLDRQSTLSDTLDWTIDNLRRVVQVTEDERLSPTAFYLREAQKYIGTNYKRTIGLDDVAQAVGISPFYLSHLFKQELGITFLKYLTDFRMRTAWQLREKTALPLAQLAESVGYRNVAYFTRVFHEYEAKRRL
jgi:two-component system response regulator YesN